MPRSAPVRSVTPALLLQAYSVGLFPMAESATDPGLFWVEPQLRGIFPLDGLIVSKSLAKTIRADRFTIRSDSDFEAVIASCAAAAPDRPSTWINATIRTLYRTLFDQGHVHTVEAYRDGHLLGGLYGVSVGAAFFGESMFHRETDASKVCLVHLAARLIRGGYRLLDTQFVTPHLTTLGAVEIPQGLYRELLQHAVAIPAAFPARDTTMSGSEVLAVLDAVRSTEPISG